MLLEDQSLINLRHSERFKILSNLIRCRRGWIELVQRQVIDIGHSLGASSLRKAFALAILNRKEGLVLKPDEPYFDFADQRRKFSSCCIKLKKEYVGNFGDVGDFAVLGARYDPTKATTYRIPGLKWTHFYIGCLDNREEVKRWNVKPEFTIVNVVELNETILKEVVTYANPVPVTPEDNDKITLKLAPGVEQGSPLTFVFTKPLVFDLRCFSFDKVGNTGFWSLRFPSVTKVHFDRDFTDTISFEQLQAMAKDATIIPELEDSQENLQWIANDDYANAISPKGFSKHNLLLVSDFSPSSKISRRCPDKPFSRTRSTCRIAGEKCRLAKKIILTPPGLLDFCPEAKALFDEHGIHDVITSAEEWFRVNKSRTLHCNYWLPGPDAFLIVESGRIEETKALLSRIEEMRKDIPEERRDWVTVFDWRLLKYVTVMDDDSITLKYYDGWHDPWARWHIGIV
ncbi:hypothetical protein ACJ41O_013405 [Fusarium nematophilum]